MRDLIDLVESVGLANRKPGAVFVNAQGNRLFFSSLDFFPDAGEFNSQSELSTAIDQQASAVGITAGDIIWGNDSRGARAFGLAHFVDDANQDYYFGRYFKTINANRLANRFPNNLPGGYNLQTGAAAKERSGYKPTDILSDLQDLTPDDILAQVSSHFGPDSDESQAMQIFMQADSFPVTMPLGQMNFAAFTNYFCEILQPMALVMGKPVKGNATEAEARFLSQGGFTDCTISFGSAQTQGLVDSVLTNSAGQTIGLSSKAKAGAKASAANLRDKVQEMQTDVQGRKLLSKYKTEIDILDAIVTGGYANGPLRLAEKFDIINRDQANQVRSLKNSGTAAVDTLDPVLRKLYSSRQSADPSRVVPFYHLLAAVAHRVADHVNNQTKFSEAAANILNYGAFIQSYTTARQQGKNIVLDAFKVVYPSEAVTGVKLRAEKTYYSTGNKGNFTFEVLLNGASSQDAEVDFDRTDTKPDVDLDALIQQPRLTGPGAKAARSQREPRMTTDVLGRELRR